MNGYIKIEANDDSISGEINMEHVGSVDKVKLLHAFCESLKISDAEMLTMMVLRDEINESTNRTVVDIGAIRGMQNRDADE